MKSAYNRNFIEAALTKAVKAIGKETSMCIDAVVDRDTSGLPGSPAIVDSITAKIAKSDIFVADISIISPKTRKRATPNPNVLYELGFASAILGWDRIILIQNDSYGGTEKLPFDLRGRRIITYNVSDENKTEKKEEVKSALFTRLREALKFAQAEVPRKEHAVWWGTWKKRSTSPSFDASLEISRVASDGFFFKILVLDGAHSGVIQGRASIVSPHSAYGRISTWDGKQCEMIFQRYLYNERWHILASESVNCLHFHGVGTRFTGLYLNEPVVAVDRGYFGELDLNELTRMCGQYLSILFDNFSIVSASTYEEGSDTFTVYTSFVKGMALSNRTIIILTDTGKIWCAGVDHNIGVVRYFFNTKEENRPSAVETWLENFAGMDIVINDPGDEPPTY